jgi:PEP-CTERM motif
MRTMFVARVMAAAVAASLGATAAGAQLVGTFNGAGSLKASGSPGVGQPVTLKFTSGLIAVPTLSGIFSPIPVGTTGTVQDVTVGVGAFNVPHFIQIGGYTFSLTFVAPGSYPSVDCFNPVAAAGQLCSPPNTPFNLANVSSGKDGLNTSASFNVSGVVTTPSAASYNYQGIFTSQFARQSYQTLIGQIDAGGTIPVSYSLNIVATTVPEPATVVLMATGLLFLVGAVHRRMQL